MEVTARELKLRLGRCLAAVRAGETIRVTLRGKPVAEIRPLPAKPMSRLDQLVAQGRAQPPTRKLGTIEPGTWTFERSPLEILLEDREDERP